MKILHIVSSINPKSGGPTRSVTGLCRGLARRGMDITLFVPTREYTMQNLSGVSFLTGKGHQPLQITTALKSVVSEGQPDIAHLHCIWMLFNHITACYLRKQNIPYVIAPRGMLEPWSLNAKKWKKRLALWLYQRRDLEHAVALHATAESEAEQFRKLGFKQPIIISPNCVDLPEVMPQRTTRKDGKKTILFLSRIHPKKGLMELVEAWAECKKCLNALMPDCVNEKELGSHRGTENDLCSAWNIEYAGPDYGGHLGEVQRRIKDLGLEGDFTYLGDLSDTEKWWAYRRADLFVLPTHSENFGIVIAEALAAGVPVITTKGTPWAELLGNSESSKVLKCESAKVRESGTTANRANEDDFRTLEFSHSITSSGRCGWWIDIGVEPLAEALREAIALSDEDRCAMGENGRKLVEAKYTWPAIAEQMKLAYAWILNGGERPDWVSVE